MVGRGVSVMPNDVLKKSKSLKYVALREYEYISENGSKPLIAEEVLTPLTEWYGKMKNEIITNPPRGSIHNLDELPFVSEVYKRFYVLRTIFMDIHYILWLYLIQAEDVHIDALFVLILKHLAAHHI